uniref:Adiponectin receptor protein 1-like n=1 Tax=Podarcis muralis TaxID=64176 RepID=A0A670KIM2_PODMU|nr:uncharacterized protein LOC114587564 isoform X4 [Podarcis muralis]
MEPLKERAGWCAGYPGEEAVAEMRPLLQEDISQDGIAMGVEPTGWGTDDPDLEENEVGTDPVRVMMLPLQAQHAMEKMEEFVLKVWEGRWRVMPYDVLPDWLKDNDFLLHGHRPPMPSFRACFRSIFRLHTETGNIWTHLLGFLFFLVLGIGYMISPNMKYVAPIQERVVFGMFFLGAILCLCFSWLFHTVYCHSEEVSRTFSKLDYSGIALLTMGSFVPWLYYSFYCSPQPQLIYLVIICVLGVTAIMVSQWDHFATPQYRAVRAGVFLGLGLSGLAPTLHFVIAEGFIKATTVGQIGWLFLMAILYILGVGLYAARIPERFFPGKCDIWRHGELHNEAIPPSPPDPFILGSPPVAGPKAKREPPGAGEGRLPLRRRERGLARGGAWGAMAAAGWSARVTALLRRMNSFHGAGSSKALCLPFMVAGQQVGHVLPSVAKYLCQYPAVFLVSRGDGVPACVELNKKLASSEQRTDAVEGVLREMRAQQDFPCLKEWREELYSVMPYFCDTPLFSMERSATPLFGVKRYGTHLNGYTWRNGQMFMWLARRALSKLTYPGLLDNMAAGGIASGLGVRETLVKESQEEACIPTSLTALAKAAGTISYTYEGAQGGIYAECQFVFDLKLPEGFVPQVGDGEVQQFYLWPLEKVKEAIGSPDFKPNCAMVALDFLIRHGYIQPDGEPHYVELVEGLHRTL